MGHKLPVKNSEKTGDYIQLKVVTVERLLALTGLLLRATIVSRSRSAYVSSFFRGQILAILARTNWPMGIALPQV